MKYRKKAVLFLSNLTPIPFDNFIEYQSGTGYVALYDNTDKYCVFCRILDKREIPEFKKSNRLKKVILKKTPSLIDENYVIVLSDHTKTLNEIDKIIAFQLYDYIQ